MNEGLIKGVEVEDIELVLKGAEVPLNKKSTDLLERVAQQPLGPKLPACPPLFEGSIDIE